MSLRFKIFTQRFAFVIATVVLLIVLIGLYLVAFKDANFEAGIEAPENNDVVEPEETIAAIEEPNFSYNVTTINIAGSCTPASMLGINSFGTFNGAVAENGNTYFLRRLTDIFRTDDLTLAACNAVLSNREDLTPAEKPELEWYIGPTSNAKVFTAGCIDGLVLECERAGDYGTAGYSETKASLEAEGLLWSDHEKAIYKEVNGLRIAFYCGKLTESNSLEIINWTDRAAQKNDLVVVYVTDTEDGYLPSLAKKKMLRSFIDAGADVVVGTNGTKIQPVESYGDGLIVYSLGALLDGATKYPDKYTAILQISIRSDNGEIAGTTYEIIPCVTYTEDKPWQPAVLSEYEELSRVNAFLRGERDTPNE